MRDANGQEIFHGQEESEDCERYCCGPARSLKLTFFSNKGEPLVIVDKPFTACLRKVRVMTPLGELLGYINQECTCSRQLTVNDATDNEIMTVTNGACDCSCSPEFEVSTLMHNLLHDL